MVFKNEKYVNEVNNAISRGWNKEKVEELYRGEKYLPMKMIVEVIAQDINGFSLKHLNALFEALEIEKWSRAEQNKSANNNGYSEASIKNKIKQLNEKGINKDTIEKFYSIDQLSLNASAEKINELANERLVNKKWLSVLLDYLEIQKRTNEENEKIRINKIKSSYQMMKTTVEERFIDISDNKNEIVNDYLNNKMSLAQLEQKYNISDHIIKTFLLENGVTIRQQMSKEKLFQMLKQSGLDQKHLYNYYVTEGHTKKDLINYISGAIGYTPGSKSIQNIVEEYELTKTAEQLKAAQGSASRKNREFSFNLLEKAGFKDGRELAEYYMSNPNLTYKTLAEELNKKCGKDNFTERWLVRYMTPHITEEFKQSQEEKKFASYIKTLTSTEIIENSRGIIKPYELDLYLPELNIAFEYNGDYWHSDKYIVTNKGMSAEAFHAVKLGLCASKNIKLAFVWESDWVNNRSEVMAAVDKFIKTKNLSPILRILTKDG